MRIEIHHDDGIVYAYERPPGADPFVGWQAYIDGHLLPGSSATLDGRGVLWQLAAYVLEGVNP